MKKARCLRMIVVLSVLIRGVPPILTAHASSLDAIGITLLRTVTTNLNGTGIRVAQPEAGAPNFEVNPAFSWVQQPVSLFTYISSGGSISAFPNGLGLESNHGDMVASNFYGMPAGIATNVAHVDNYDANYFIQVGEQIVGSTTNFIVSLPS